MHSAGWDALERIWHKPVLSLVLTLILTSNPSPGYDPL